MSTRARGFVGLIAAVAFALTLAACGAQAAAQPTEPSALTPAAVASPASASTTPTAVAGAATPAAGTPAASLTPGTGAVAIQVTPAEATVGNVTLSLALQPARHLFGQGSPVAADPAQQPQDATKGQEQGSAVFADGMLQVTNNIDSSQAAPADSAQGIVRHVVVQVKTKDRGQIVPYLKVSMDVLLDGRPVLTDQGLAPMVAVDQDAAQLYYGNNVRFPARGTYQVFVRMEPNPLLGKGQTPAAQFNLTLS